MKQLNDQSSEKQKSTSIILAIDKMDSLVRGVTGIARNGEINTTVPIAENLNKLMKIDAEGNPLSAFFQNYLNSLQQPKRFDFFRVPAHEAENTAKHMQQVIDMCDHLPKAIQRDLKIEQLKPLTLPAISAVPKKNNDVPNYKFNPDRVDWALMEKMGMSKQTLKNLNILDTLLQGHKTKDLISIKLNLGIIETRLEAKLSFKQKPDGDVVVMIHGVRKEPALDRPFLGHTFSNEDSANLRSSGNMGRTVNLLNPYTGESIPSVVSVDPLTNELIALRSAHIRVPKKISGVLLNQEQRQTIKKGEPLHLKNFIDKQGNQFDATVQLNACTRQVEYIPNLFSLDQREREKTIPTTQQDWQAKTYPSKRSMRL